MVRKDKSVGSFTHSMIRCYERAIRYNKRGARFSFSTMEPNVEQPDAVVVAVGGWPIEWPCSGTKVRWLVFTLSDHCGDHGAASSGNL